jgi:signal transduction histidine kinase
LSKTTSGNIFIGSQEGINIYDGRKVNKYFPSTHNMNGKITHSEFYEDRKENVWFANYEAIHKYNKYQDDFEILLFRNPYSNEEIKFDYRIINLNGDKLWVLAYKFLFQYNIETLQIEKWAEVDCNNYHAFSIQNDKASDYICASGQYGSKIIKLDTSWNTCSTINLNNNFSYSSTILNQNTLITGGYKGKITLYDTKTGAEIKKINLGTNSIVKLERLSKNEIIVNQSAIGIYKYNLENGEKNFLLTAQETGITDPKFTTHIITDNILWYCIEGSGCFKKDLNPYNFANQLEILITDAKIGNIVNLNDNVLVSVLAKPPVLVKADNAIESNLFDFKINTVIPINQDKCLFSSDAMLFKYDGKNAVSLNTLDTFNLMSFYRFLPLDANEYILNDKINIYTLSISNTNYSLTPQKNNIFKNASVIGLEQIADFYISSLEETHLNSFYLSHDSIIIKNKYNIQGDLKAVHEETDSFYAATRYGLFKCDKNSNGFRQILDDNNYLNQTIYSILPQKNGDFWMSSNSGLIKYNPSTNQSFKFTTEHGLPGNEFNTYSYTIGQDGKFYFGGQFGLVSFHPDSVILSNKEPTIHLSNFQVNGINYKKQSANTITKVELPYFENRLSFGFHAIDYSNGTTRTKYKMSDIDDNWVVNENTSGIVSYPALSPGNYTFSILGTNSDGVWSKTPRDIHITIHPPWYATWWARSLGILLLAGLIYFLFRSYYKRQLREKDLQIREANLKIAKQKALSEERTRIASEMHDDLGGGLTTIRFLSQKALRNTSDDYTKSLISKIASNSEFLVNNMSEIIWAMNARFDTLQSLIAYCRRYANEYLEDHDFSIQFNMEGETQDIKISGIERRNIFLALKESLHNIVKHSEANKVDISFLIKDKIKIKIHDNGKGFNQSNEFGNGIENMKKRIQSINGTLHIHSDRNGTTVEITLKIKNNAA